MNPIFVSDNINKLKSNTTKFCGHCKMEKDLIEFYKNKYEIDGLRAICKVCVKEYNDKNKEKAKKMTRKEYYQKYYEKAKERRRIWSYLPQGVFRVILNRAKKRNLECMTKEEFIDWYKNQKRECHYCKRSEEETCKEIVNGRKFGRLSIDRKDNTRGYILNNIVLACFRCNGIKSNYFTEQEMLQIGAIINIKEADRKTLEDEFNLKKENKMKTELQKLGVL
jgi:hypothetical protein